MIGEAAGYWSFGGEASQALVEVERFIAERNVNLVGFTPETYFGFILFMGVVIGLGAVGQLWRKSWGLSLICLYLSCHTFLFINFMTVNPKLLWLILASALTGVLWWANQRDQSEIMESLDVA
jgi:hypothetical protein